jgi:hypothetical protein
MFNRGISSPHRPKGSTRLGTLSHPLHANCSINAQTGEVDCPPITVNIWGWPSVEVHLHRS